MGDSLGYVPLGTGRYTLAVGMGDKGSCALLDDQTIKCWGKSNDGEAGQGTTFDIGDGSGEMGDNLPAIDFDGDDMSFLAGGNDHCCAITTTDTLKCLGRNTQGEGGQGTTNNIGDGSNEVFY